MPDFGSISSRLGCSRGDRVVVLHADDIGMCEATVAAFRDIRARGIVSSASTMVPCGWFPSVAMLCQEIPEHDMGVHLTLTSEWASYRWGPVLGAEVKELCDGAGYFFPDAREVRRPSARDAAYHELRAQILRAQRLGIQLSHIDSHMFAVLHPNLFGLYAALSREFRIPCVVLPLFAQELLQQLDAEQREHLLVFDGWAQLPLDDGADRLTTAERILDGLPTGLSYLISHPAVDSRELRAIAPDWRARVADYQLYMDDGWARAVERAGIKVVGMRAVRDALFGERR